MLTRRKIKKLLNLIKLSNLNNFTFKFVKNFITHLTGSYKRNINQDIPYPTTIMLELTNKCNLHCVTCPREYGYGKDMRIGVMETELAKKIIDETLPYIQSIGLTGMGETLFAPNLLEIAKYIKERKKSVIIFISTNANIPGFIEKITPVLPYVDTVQISTDGIHKVYEEVRVGAKFDTLEQNINRLIALTKGNTDIMFNMVITKLNYTDMPNVIQFAHGMGIGYVNFTYFNLASVTDLGDDYYEFFSSKEFKDKLIETKETAKRIRDVEVTGLDFPGNPGIRKCPLMWNHFQINHDGEVPPCCAKPFSAQYSFGNVINRPLIDVLNSPKGKVFRNSWVTQSINKFCEKCQFVKL